MKKQAIIPLFIPHMGCPHDCVFCNQNAITATDSPITVTDVKRIVDSRLADLLPLGLDHLEAAFFGGSFNGLPVRTQREFLSALIPYKQNGLIQKIRLSTRPDYISSEILDMLSSYEVDIIELGAQSFDDGVLLQSSRGHTAAQTIQACHMIIRKGFSLGIQLMVGLPGDTKEKSLSSAGLAVGLAPDFVRIYPTVVLEGSMLAEMLRNGDFHPTPFDQTVETVKEMVRIFDQHQIPVIRVGLKSTGNICVSADLSGNYHPAFRQLVEGSLAYDDVAAQLQALGIMDGRVLLRAHPASFSNLVGHKAMNKRSLSDNFPDVRFSFRADASIPKNKYSVTAL